MGTTIQRWTSYKRKRSKRSSPRPNGFSLRWSTTLATSPSMFTTQTWWRSAPRSTARNASGLLLDALPERAGEHDVTELADRVLVWAHGLLTADAGPHVATAGRTGRAVRSGRRAHTPRLRSSAARRGRRPRA